VRFFDPIPSVLGITAARAAAADDAFREALGGGARSVGAAAGGIFMLDEGSANLELTVAARYPASIVERYRLIPMVANLPLVDAVKTSTPIILESLADYVARYPDFARAHPDVAEKAFAALPLVVDGRCVGALGLGFEVARGFTSDDRTKMVALAGWCTSELERLARLDADRAAHSRAELASQRLERLHVFTGALGQSITPAQVVDTVIGMGPATTSARSSALWLAAPDGASLVLSRKIGSGGPGSEDVDRVPIDDRSRLPLLDAVRDGVPLWIESRSQLEERYQDMAGRFPGGGDGAFVFLPLLAEGGCIGALTYGFEGTHRFLEDERAFLRVVSWYAAQAIERANAYAAVKVAKERAEGSQRRSELLADIDVLLASSLDHSNILNEVARAAVPRFADWCVLELVDQRLRGTPPIASHADPSKVPLVLEMRLRLREMGDFSQGIAAVMRSGISLLHRLIPLDTIVASVGAESSMVKLAAEVGIASAVVVPMSARGQVLGAILLCRGDPEHRYDEQDLVVAEDLGRRIGLAVDNARLYQEARDADRLKGEFLAMLSHELRNPLAPVVTALDLMDRSGEKHFSAEREMITRHVRHLVRLLDDLLDMARTTRGKVQLLTERSELATIVAAAVEVASPLVAQRAHRLTILVPERGLQVMADPARLTQAIGNLVTNAAKYTAPGGAISVEAVADGGEAVVTVRDSGAGIAPDLLPRIFDAFVQGSSAIDRSQGGLGIGLTVAKSVVTLHGGTLAARSGGLGHGSEFVVRLPRVEPVIAVPEKAAPHAAPSAAGDRYRVLAVDDNRDAADMLGRLLLSLGCSALVVHDGAAALASAAGFKPHLVLLDIGLPGIDGYEVARRLRGTLPGPSLKIIAISGYGQPSDRQRSRIAGFDDHIVKPVAIDVLQRLVEDYRERALTTDSRKGTS
jgi:signal transduction histidine kinase/ActR/RegA family two-component response regulator